MKLSYPVCCPDTTQRIMAWCDSYEDAFPFLKNAGYDGIELLVRNPDSVDRDKLAKLLSDNSMLISAVGTTPMQKEDQLFLLDPDPEKSSEAVRRLYGLIDLAAFFRAPVLIGKYRGTVQEKVGCRLSDLAAIMQKADAYAMEKGIVLFLEPQNKTNINNLNSIGESVAWIEQNNFRNTKLLMDLFHMDVTEDSIADSILRYRQYLGMVHMTDSGRKVPGAGSLDMAGIIDALKEAGFSGYLSMEIKQEPDSPQAAVYSAEALMPMIKG